MAMVPGWLHILSVGGLALGIFCALTILLDEVRNPQRMWIMNVVWPVTALFGTIISLWAYFRYGRHAAKMEGQRAEAGIRQKSHQPFPVVVGKAAAHCGSGCCLGDICAEWLAFFIPGIAVALGWGSLFSEKMFAVWILDFFFAFAIGIVFQYFTIKPMRKLSFAKGIVQALKADTLSLCAWQVGMYGYMAFAQFFLFRSFLHAPLEVASAEFWFMMQIAMLAGFTTSYPVNWWLVRAGVKERM